MMSVFSLILNICIKNIQTYETEGFERDDEKVDLAASYGIMVSVGWRKMKDNNGGQYGTEGRYVERKIEESFRFRSLNLLKRRLFPSPPPAPARNKNKSNH